MEWKLTKEDERPLTLEQMGCGKQEYVWNKSQKREVSCLCKYTDNSTPCVLIYNSDVDGWLELDSDRSKSVEFDKVEKWCLLSDVDNALEGKLEPKAWYEFGSSLAKTAIPALEIWLEKGVSCKYGMKSEEWRNILTKIKQGFEVSLSDLNGGVYDSLEERERVLKKHDAVRKEAFALMAEHYLDLWD